MKKSESRPNETVHKRVLVQDKNDGSSVSTSFIKCKKIKLHLSSFSAA